MESPRPTQNTGPGTGAGEAPVPVAAHGRPKISWLGCPRPTPDLTGEHVGDKSHVAETAAGVHIREIRDPPLIGALSLRPGLLNTIRETLGEGPVTVVCVVVRRSTPATPRIFMRCCTLSRPMFQLPR